nr:hypothetical protein Iba_chr09dCG13310 [Ipomoea batatas]
MNCTLAVVAVVAACAGAVVAGAAACDAAAGAVVSAGAPLTCSAGRDEWRGSRRDSAPPLGVRLRCRNAGEDHTLLAGWLHLADATRHHELVGNTEEEENVAAARCRHEEQRVSTPAALLQVTPLPSMRRGGGDRDATPPFCSARKGEWEKELPPRRSASLPQPPALHRYRLSTPRPHTHCRKGMDRGAAAQTTIDYCRRHDCREAFAESCCCTPSREEGDVGIRGAPC